MRPRIAALPQGATWLASFDQFLSVYGQRVEETCRIDIPSWAEDPSPALYTIGAFLAKPAGFDFHAARAAAVAERDAQIEEARRAVNGADLTRFNEALASNQAANFAWWNEEHNYLIDRRAAIPVRRATLELGARLASSGEIADPTDLFFAFKPELFDVMSGGGSSSWAELRAMIPDRRAYFEHWRERGPSLPPMLGTIPDVVPDPIMIEVFGLSGQFLETMRGDAGAAGARTAPPAAGVTEIRGFPAAKGVVEGVARVITTVGDLHLVEPGEILVCGGTTTEWTPAFGIITACVCDTGGSLTHAAIVSREYGIPCVVGTAIATQVVKTGDRVRVDGRAGTSGCSREGSGGVTDVAVVDLGEIRAADAGRVGPKMARLGQLAADGWRVPDGYAVTAGALDGWLPAAARGELARLFTAPAPGHGELTGLAARARELIESQPLPSWLEDAVAGAHARLCRADRAGRRAAGRRAVVGRERGRAGGQLRRAVRDVPRGVRRRRRAAARQAGAGRAGSPRTPSPTGSGSAGPRRCATHDLAVGVLELVDARSAGVAFTLDPVTGDRGVCVVEGNWGFGESVVSGQVTPDHWTVDRATGRVLTARTGAKRDLGGLQSRRRPGGAVAAARLTWPGRRASARTRCATSASGRPRIESAAGGVPQDVEWAVARDLPFPDSVFFLQHRPETTWTAGAAGGRGRRGRRGARRRRRRGAAFDPVQYALRNVFKVPGT